MLTVLWQPLKTAFCLFSQQTAVCVAPLSWWPHKRGTKTGTVWYGYLVAFWHRRRKELNDCTKQNCTAQWKWGFSGKDDKTFKSLSHFTTVKLRSVFVTMTNTSAATSSATAAASTLPAATSGPSVRPSRCTITQGTTHCTCEPGYTISGRDSYTCTGTSNTCPVT